jgi:hypothetical protein
MDTKEMIMQLTAERGRIDQVINVASTIAAPPTTRKKRQMSAEARKRIGDAQRKRWAAVKKAR